MNYSEASETVQRELAYALGAVQADQVEALVAAISRAPRIYVAGAGRVGFAAQAFAMRLMHLGLSCWYVDDVTTPAIGAGDLLLLPSGSGETASMCVIADRAAGYGARIATVTREPGAHIGKLADVVVELLPSRAQPAPSAQPMTTLFEQSLFLLLDAIVLILMERLGQGERDMARRHRNVE